MISRSITVADVAAITGFSRHKLKGLFRELPGFNAPAEQARKAREFTRHELIVLAVCCELDERYGLKRTTIGQLLDSLQQALNGPRPIARQVYLLIDIPAQTVSYFEESKTAIDGLIISIDAILSCIDKYLEYGSSGPLNLGPVSLSASTQVEKAAENMGVQVSTAATKIIGGKR